MEPREELGNFNWGLRGVREDLEEETFDLSFKTWAGVGRHTGNARAFQVEGALSKSVEA